MAKEKKQAEPSFEAGLKRLEEVLDALEHGDLSLEEAMRAFEEGVQLVRVCHKKLDEWKSGWNSCSRMTPGGFSPGRSRRMSWKAETVFGFSFLVFGYNLWAEPKTRNEKHKR